MKYRVISFLLLPLFLFAGFSYEYDDKDYPSQYSLVISEILYLMKKAELSHADIESRYIHVLELNEKILEVIDIKRCSAEERALYILAVLNTVIVYKMMQEDSRAKQFYYSMEQACYEWFGYSFSLFQDLIKKKRYFQDFVYSEEVGNKQLYCIQYCSEAGDLKREEADTLFKDSIKEFVWGSLEIGAAIVLAETMALGAIPPILDGYEHLIESWNKIEASAENYREADRLNAQEGIKE